MALSMRGVPLRGISRLVARPSVRARARIMVAKVSGVTVHFLLDPTMARPYVIALAPEPAVRA
jgi:hypothetical protein